MDWFKVSTKYLYHSGFTSGEFMAYCQLMGLTSMLEKMPSREKMLTIVTEKRLKCVENRLQVEGVPLEYVLQKVLEDVEKVKHKRDYWKQEKAQQRVKVKNVRTEVHTESIPKIRVDKSRLDKSREDNTIYSYYSNNIHIITPAIADNIIVWLSDVPEEWIKAAIDRAISANARNWNYIEACLKAWKQKGYIDEKKKGASSGKQTNADRTVEAVNSYLKSIGQGGDFSEISRSSNTERCLTE